MERRIYGTPDLSGEPRKTRQTLLRRMDRRLPSAGPGTPCQRLIEPRETAQDELQDATGLRVHPCMCDPEVLDRKLAELEE